MLIHNFWSCRTRGPSVEERNQQAILSVLLALNDKMDGLSAQISAFKQTEQAVMATAQQIVDEANAEADVFKSGIIVINHLLDMVEQNKTNPAALDQALLTMRTNVSAFSGAIANVTATEPSTADTTGQQPSSGTASTAGSPTAGQPTTTG